MRDGREQIVRLLFPGEFVGHPYMQAADFTATALNDAELCVVPHSVFERAPERARGMERLLLKRTLAALQKACMRMLTLGRKTAAEKVAGFLLDMAARLNGEGRQARHGDASIFERLLAGSEIADLLGLMIETLSRQMTKPKAVGIIAIPGMRVVTIIDMPALETRADRGVPPAGRLPCPVENPVERGTLRSLDLPASPSACP